MKTAEADRISAVAAFKVGRVLAPGTGTRETVAASRSGLPRLYSFSPHRLTTDIGGEIAMVQPS
jgi:hypothetical protein